MKKRILMVILFSIILMVLVGCVTTGSIPRIEVIGLNDRLERETTVTTQNYNKLSSISVGSQDWYFRGYLNKETKQVSYQLYVIIKSHPWVWWDTAKFKISGEIKEQEFLIVDTKVNYTGGECICCQYGVLHLERDVLETWKNGPHIVSFSTSSYNVDGYIDIIIDPKEVVDFLKMMDFINPLI